MIPDQFCVYDPDGPAIYGPFVSDDAAFEHANLLHPEDGNGNCVILPLSRV